MLSLSVLWWCSWSWGIYPSVWFFSCKKPVPRRQIIVSGKQKELSSIFQAERIKTLVNLKWLWMLSFQASKAFHLWFVFLFFFWYIGYLWLCICISLCLERTVANHKDKYCLSPDCSTCCSKVVQALTTKFICETCANFWIYEIKIEQNWF